MATVSLSLVSTTAAAAVPPPSRPLTDAERDWVTRVHRAFLHRTGDPRPSRPSERETTIRQATTVALSRL